jgi:hypothetical protein
MFKPKIRAFPHPPVFIDYPVSGFLTSPRVGRRAEKTGFGEK